MLLVCYSFLHIQSISSITVKKVGYWDTSGVPKKIAEVAQKKEQELAHDEFYPQSKWDKNLQGFRWMGYS